MLLTSESTSCTHHPLNLLKDNGHAPLNQSVLVRAAVSHFARFHKQNGSEIPFRSPRPRRGGWSFLNCSGLSERAISRSVLTSKCSQRFGNCKRVPGRLSIASAILAAIYRYRDGCNDQLPVRIEIGARALENAVRRFRPTSIQFQTANPGPAGGLRCGGAPYSKRSSIARIRAAWDLGRRLCPRRDCRREAPKPALGIFAVHSRWLHQPCSPAGISRQQSPHKDLTSFDLGITDDPAITSQSSLHRWQTDILPS